MEREVKGLRRINEEMEGSVGSWGREWRGEVGNLGLGEEDGVEGFDLGGIERELGVLEEWVRIAEDEGEGEVGGSDSERVSELGQGQGQGKGKSKEPGEGAERRN